MSYNENGGGYMKNNAKKKAKEFIKKYKFFVTENLQTVPFHDLI